MGCGVSRRRSLGPVPPPGRRGAAFGLLALAFRQRPSLAHYAPPVYALFVAAAANLALVIGPFNRFLSATEPYQVMAEDKIAQFLSIVPVLVILSWLARRDSGWIYVQRGRPRRWLPFGLASLAVCAVAVALMSVVACGGGGGNDAPPWQQTIEAACAAPAACPTFPLLDGTPRPTAVTTPRPGFPTATPPPLTEAEALATRQPAAMTAAAEGMAARATGEAAP